MSQYLIQRPTDKSAFKFMIGVDNAMMSFEGVVDACVDITVKPLE